MGNLGTFMKGAPLSKADIADEGTPFILYGELYTTYGEVTRSIKRRTDKAVEPQFYSKVGDVIMPTSGETPEDIATASCIMLPDVILAGDLLIYRTQKVDGRLVSFVVKNKVNKQISSVAQGKSVVHVRAEELSKITLSYPSDAEQQKILTMLELIEDKIAKQRELIEHLKKYKRGVYKSIFATSRLDCKWVSLGELCEIITKGTTPQSFLSEGTIRYIKIESIVDGHIVNENCKFIDRTTHEGTLSRSVLKEGDILFSIAGSLGVCVIVQQSNLPANTNQALAIIRLKEAENRNYILSVLRSSLMEEYILASRTTGAQPNLSLQQMRDFKLPYPNADEQQKIALFAEMMEKRLTSEQRKLEKLLEVKSALLQQLFI